MIGRAGHSFGNGFVDIPAEDEKLALKIIGIGNMMRTGNKNLLHLRLGLARGFANNG